MKFTDCPHRLRTDGIRPLVSKTTLDTTDLVAPVFVDATTDERVPIESILGHERVPITEAADRTAEMREAGVRTVVIFGIPELKDPEGSRTYARNGVVQGAVRAITVEMDTYVVTDICFCKYTDHGHCGVLEDHAEDDPTLTVENRPTLDLLAETAISHAEAGMDMAAPSAPMDGIISAICAALDDAGHDKIPVMSCTTKCESTFYGPFRSAADGAPAFDDRRHYQMNPANTRETLRKVALDVERDADMLIIKPGLSYLDIVHAIRRGYGHPVAVYNISGEYAMLHTAAKKGWLDLDEAAHESLLSMERAGADLIITYSAGRVARQFD